jgi:hypothetical protein
VILQDRGVKGWFYGIETGPAPRAGKQIRKWLRAKMMDAWQCAYDALAE